MGIGGAMGATAKVSESGGIGEHRGLGKAHEWELPFFDRFFEKMLDELYGGVYFVNM
jgi:hypothetical protein